MGSSGIAFLPRGGPPISHYLALVGDAIGKELLFHEDLILGRLKELLSPLVREALAGARAAEVQERLEMCIAIALVRGQEAVVNTLTIADEPVWERYDAPFLSAPGSLADFFKARCPDPSDYLGPTPDNREAVAAHAKQLLLDAIEHSASLAGPREVCGPVDVALIDAAGARFV
jgi:hypothetical protein